MFIIIGVIFVSTLLTTIKYILSTLKSLSVYLLHGFSVIKLLSKSIKNILLLSLMAFIIAIIVTMIYIHGSGYTGLVTPLFQLLFFLFCILLLIYSLMTIFIIKRYTYLLRGVSFLKGSKPNWFIQPLNHSLKVIFFTFFLMSFHHAWTGLQATQHLSSQLVYWEEMARDVYGINFHETGEYLGVNDDIQWDFYERLERLFHYLATQHGGFIMSSDNAGWIERSMNEEGAGFRLNDVEISQRIDPWGYRVTVTPNFFDTNPIYDVHGREVREQLILDRYVLNILVPEDLQPYEIDIIDQFQMEFYDRWIRLQNDYLRDMGRPLLVTEIDNLTINVIYVATGQYYFSFETLDFLETAGRIPDPVAVVLTGNFSLPDMSHFMTVATYFKSESIDPRSDLVPILEELRFDHMFRIRPTFDTNMERVFYLRDQLFRLTVFFIILLGANMLITYNLIANYFESYKFKLTIQSHFGYHPLKRLRRFLQAFLLYSVFIIAMMSAGLGWSMLLFGIGFLLFDLGLAIFFEKRLMAKSFAQIMKGGR